MPGSAGGLLAVVLQLAAPGAFALALSLSLLTAVVLGGLGSLVGAVWGAAMLVLLPSWTNDLAHSFSLSTKVSANLPLAIYGFVLIARDARSGRAASRAACGRVSRGTRAACARARVELRRQRRSDGEIVARLITNDRSIRPPGGTSESMRRQSHRAVGVAVAIAALALVARGLRLVSSSSTRA